MKVKVYDLEDSLKLSLSALKKIFKDSRVSQVLFKRLAPNDNSKNQPYLASHISELSFLPSGNLPQEPSSYRQIRFKASIPLSWLDADGNEYPAPSTQIIYYPQYPEVRLSGFLKGSMVRGQVLNSALIKKRGVSPILSFRLEW